MSVAATGAGHFQIPTAPAAGTSVTSGAANAYTTNAVQLTASSSAIFITGVHIELAAVSAATYTSIQLMSGGAGSETAIGQYLIPLSTGSTVALGFHNIYPPLKVANATRISVKAADSVGAKAYLVSLECILQSNVVDDGVAVATVTTVTNQLTAAAIATGVWQDATAGDFTTASSIGKTLYIANVAPGGSGGLMISGSNAGTTTLGALTITGATTHTGNMVLSDGLTISSPSTGNRAGLDISGNGTGAAIKATGGATGIGFNIIGGATSGDGLKITTTSGHGINLAPVGTSMHGLFSTGGNGGTSDGIKAAAGTGGVDIRGNITGNLVGTVSTLTTYTGNTVQTGDSFAIVKSGGTGDNAAIKAKTDNLPAAPASTTNITAGIITTTTNVTNPVSLSAADTPSLATGTATAGGATSITLQTALGADSLVVGSLIKITSGLGTKQTRVITAYVDATKVVTVDRAWVTNPDATSVYAVMYNEAPKLDSSLQDTAASVTGAVGSVTGLTASNLDATISSRMATYTQPTGFLAATFPAGIVANTTNITAGTITTATNLTTNNDKTGYALSAAGVQAIWDALTSALTTVGSIGKLLVDNINATISSRLASASYTAPDNTGIAAIKVQTDKLVFTVAGKVDSNIHAVNDVTVAGVGTSATPWGP